jgi:hypothetical protein
MPCSGVVLVWLDVGVASLQDACNQVDWAVCFESVLLYSVSVETSWQPNLRRTQPAANMSACEPEAMLRV